MINEAHVILVRRYGKAFFNLYAHSIDAQECRLMKNAAVYLRANSAWSTFFDFPPLTPDKQKQMAQLLLDYLTLPKVFERLCSVLCIHKRMVLLPDILDAIVTIFFKYNQVLGFTITSFPELTHTQTQTFVDFLQKNTGKVVHYECKIDNRLIAGIRACSNSLLWEHSIAKKLRDAQQVALNGNNQ